jgi:hypothetical protein
MAHFCKLDENNIVTQVIVVSNDDIKDTNGIEVEEIGVAFCKKLLGADTNWKQTSYNNNFRKRYAGIGMQYNEEFDSFIHAQPHPSWILNPTTLEWESPIPVPKVDEDKKKTHFYLWDENTLSWNLEPNSKLSEYML